MKNTSWFFTSDSIYEYAEVTSRAITHGATPLTIVAMVTSNPIATYVNHKNVAGIGVVDGVMQTWTTVPENIPHLTLGQIRSKHPKSYESLVEQLDV